MSLIGSATNFISGGANQKATDAQQKALDLLAQLQTPTLEQLSLPELQKYAASVGMSPAQMQAFLQQSNAYNAPISQTGTDAQIAAINQLAGVANAGAAGSPTQQAQVEQINQEAARNLAGQRGAIEQQAAARGVPVGMLQAALEGQQAGQGLQDAHMAALQAQGQNYQQALSAMAQGAGAGQALQGQQNAQANTVAQAQNAMQQFNAANQQNASQTNAANQQQANMFNTQNTNQTNQANTGLVNQRTGYNAALPQQIYNNNLAKATGMANQYNNMAQTYGSQGQQAAGLVSGIIGGASTLAGGMMGGPAGAAAGSQVGKSLAPTAAPTQYESLSQHGTSFPGSLSYAKGGVIQPYAEGGVCMPNGGMVPGRPKVPGDSYANDTVNAKLSPGELVVPRTAVPHVISLMAQHRPAGPTNHPEDVAALLAAMRHLRGAAA